MVGQSSYLNRCTHYSEDCHTGMSLTSYQVDPPQMLFGTGRELKSQILTHETKDNTALYAAEIPF